MPGHLPTTGPVDVIQQYYSPGIGWFLRRRMAWLAKELPRVRVDRMLEIGYGSGIGQYFYGPRARRSFGIDVHRLGRTVADALAADGLPCALACADGQALPFRSASFDLVIAVSALEFIPSPLAALTEAMRVLAPGGLTVCLRPRTLSWADALYQRLSGRDPEAEFQGGRQRVDEAITTIGGSRVRATRLSRPRRLPSFLAPYEVVVLTHEREGR